jgi:HK97 family phage major capsid protein
MTGEASATPAPIPVDASVTEIKQLIEKNFQGTQDLVTKYGTRMNGLEEATNAAKAQAEKLDKEFVEIQKFLTTMNRPGIPGVVSGKNAEWNKEYSQYLKRGTPGPTMQDMYQKALVTGDSTLGGYLAPPEFVAEIIKLVAQIYSPIRQIATVRQTNANTIMVPTRTSTFTASWTAEGGSMSQTTGLKYGLEQLPTHLMTAYTLASLRELNDAAFNVDQQIQMESAEQFGVAEGTAFVSGNGVGKPEGLLTNTGISYTPGTDASSLKAEGIMNLFYAVKDVYARNGTFIMNRATTGLIRQMRDTTGHWLWEPGFNGPAMGSNTWPSDGVLMGKPIVECVDMPIVSSNAYPIMFGDFSKAYWIADNSLNLFKRDDTTLLDQAMVRFIGIKAVDGQVVQPEAVRKLKIATG